MESLWSEPNYFPTIIHCIIERTAWHIRWFLLRRNNSSREFSFAYNHTSLLHTSGIWIERHDDTLQSVVWCTDLRYSLRRTCLVGRARKWWMRTWLWSGWDLLDQILREDLVAETNLPSLQKTEPSFRYPSNFHWSHWMVSLPGYYCS